MLRIHLSALWLSVTIAFPLLAQSPPARPVHTYSIVAVDSATGQIGVAVQSHWFSVGTVVSWAEPGVGAVATQSFANPSYGPSGLHLMANGLAAPEALAALLHADADSQVRQVAMIDAHGEVAAHTGSLNIPSAGHQVGRWYSVQANLMRNDRIWPAMAQAFEETTGELAERLVAALEAAEAAGGDIRGRQSAALVVVEGDPSLPSWERVYDLRVDDSPRPLVELRRLLRVARAYRAATQGDEHVTEGDIDAAMNAYARAAEILPDSATNGELVFWQAVTLAGLGRHDEAVPLFRRSFAQDESWKELLRRLPGVGLLDMEPRELDRLIGDAAR